MGDMSEAMWISAAAFLSLVPAALYLAVVRPAQQGPVVWALWAVAVAGPAGWLMAHVQAGWPTGFAAALWVSVCATLLAYAVAAGVLRQAWRLGAVLMPLLALFGAIALMWGAAGDAVIGSAAPWGWLGAHIAVSVATYALVTVAAVAGLAVLLREAALRHKRPGGFVRVLPPVADAERSEMVLLATAEVVLGIGLVTGMATQYVTTGSFFDVTHKTLLAVLAFVLIGVLLWLRRRGMRGRQAARVVLAGYLLLTLAYPGVKFVTDVLLA